MGLCGSIMAPIYGRIFVWTFSNTLREIISLFSSTYRDRVVTNAFKMYSTDESLHLNNNEERRDMETIERPASALLRCRDCLALCLFFVMLL